MERTANFAVGTSGYSVCGIGGGRRQNAIPFYGYSNEWLEVRKYIGVKPMKYYDIKGETVCETKLLEILRL